MAAPGAVHKEGIRGKRSRKTGDARCIWVVEDDTKFRLNLMLDLEEGGYAVQGHESCETAIQELREQKTPPPDLMLLDVRMPGKSGVETVRELSAEQRLPPTIIISGEASISETVEALHLGVHDFIEKPFTRERLLRSIYNCLEYQDLRRKVLELQTGSGIPLIGESPAMVRLNAQIQRIAPTEGRVLILGESGTGKELVADVLHRQSARAGGPFIKINCASVPATLIEDELFGHVRGAFTGARDDKPGLFEAAHQGTFFLDEIGDMELSLQTRLLRVLEDGRVRRLGGRREIEVDVRIVSATNRDLKEAIEKGTFREDLYFRLCTLPIEVPPLRERGGDVSLLAAFYVERFCRENKMRLKTMTPSVLKHFEQYQWPGNVRELRNLCERLVIIGGDPVDVGDLPSDILRGRSKNETGLVRLPYTHMSISLRNFKAQCEKEFIENALKRNNWDYVETARQLDIQRTYLHRKISQLDIRKPHK